MVKMLKNTKKDKIVTLSFPKFVSFYYISLPEGLRISKIFFAILHTKILIDNREGFFLSLSKTKKIKKINYQGRYFQANNYTPLIVCK